MIAGQRVLGVIVARGGSKGLPRKNILPLRGKPLIAWSIAAAAGSQLLDRAVVSTDDKEIAETAKHWHGDVPFLRPPELATDTASIVDVVLHAAGALKEEYRYVVLLQATSPLRLSADIDGAVTLLVERGAPACVSVTRQAKSPEWMFRMNGENALDPVLPAETLVVQRQKLAPAYLLNGAVYVVALEQLRRTRSFHVDGMIGYEMPAERSVDIDTSIDLKLAEVFVK